MSKALNKVDRSRLDHMVSTFRKNEAGFKDNVIILATIHRENLWRDDAETFKEFCEVTLGISKQRGYQLLDFGRMLAEMEADGVNIVDSAPVILPANEGQARELKKAPKEARAGVMREAAADGNPSAAGVAAAVKKVKNEAKADTPAKADTKPQPAADDPLWAEFEAAIRAEMTVLRGVADRLRKVLDTEPKTHESRAKWAHFFPYNGSVGAVNSVIRNMEGYLPVAVAKESPGYINKHSHDIKQSINNRKATG